MTSLSESASRMLPTLLAILSLAVLGCAPSAAPRVEAAPQPSVAPTPAEPESEVWAVRHDAAVRSQRIMVSATLESRVDTVVRMDSVRSELAISWNASTGGLPRRYAGRVTEYLVASGADSITGPSFLALPLGFTAEQRERSGALHFTSPAAEGCGSPEAAAGWSIINGARDLWASLPDTLVQGMTWTDSTSLRVCRDSIPLEAVVVRSFRVTGASRRERGLVATLERRTTTRVTGAGTQFDEAITIDGEGAGSMMLEVALNGASVVFASGDAELRLTLRGRRKVQELTQRSRISILER